MAVRVYKQGAAELLRRLAAQPPAQAAAAQAARARAQPAANRSPPAQRAAGAGRAAQADCFKRLGLALQWGFKRL